MIIATLLDVQLADSDIMLRLDHSDIAHHEITWHPLVLLSLHQCQDVAHTFSTLQHAVGEQVEYEIDDRPDGATVSVWINYMADALEIRCTAAHENEAAATMHDIKQICERLGKLYLQSANEAQMARRRYYSFNHRLKIEIRKEIDRHQRKVAFFTPDRPEKASIVAAQGQVYQRVLALIASIAEDENQSMP
jgi:hypothetical protein